MDFLKLGLDTSLEGIVNLVNALLTFMVEGIMYIHKTKEYLNMDSYFDGLKNYSSNLAYSILVTAVLLFILKTFIFEDNSMDLSEFAFRVLKTIVAIEATPVLMNYIADQSANILGKTTSLVAVSTPSISSIDFAAILLAIPLMNNLVSIFVSIILVISIIGIVCWVVVFISTVMLAVLIMILEVLAPLVAVSNLSNYPALYLAFLKDVFRIYIARIFQVTFVKVACVMLIQSQITILKGIVSAKDSITSALIESLMTNIFALALMVTLIFLPKLLEKYVAASNGGSSGIANKATSSVAGLASRFIS